MTKAFGLALKKMFIDNKRIFIRFIVSLTVCVALIGVLCSVTAFATDSRDIGQRICRFVRRYGVGRLFGNEGSYRC